MALLSAFSVRVGDQDTVAHPNTLPRCICPELIETSHCARLLSFCCYAIQPAVDKSVERVQTKLASMLNRLELEISEVEKRIGDKMVRSDYMRTRRCLSSWGWFKGKFAAKCFSERVHATMV